MITHAVGDEYIAHQLHAQLGPLVHAGHLQLTTLAISRSPLFGGTVPEAALRHARLFIPILSPEFVAEPLAWRQLELAVELARRGQLLVMPILARALDLGATPLAGWFRAVGESQPLDRAEDLGTALSKLAVGIRRGFEPRTDALASRPRHEQGPRPRRVLAVFATPPDEDPLQLANEQRLIEGELDGQDGVELRCLVAATLADIHRELRRGNYDTVHLSCHHGLDSGMILSDEVGGSCPLDPAGLAELFRRHGIRDVILNMCNSNAVVEDHFFGFEHVIAMSGPIADYTATRFSQALYLALAHGASLEGAFADARAVVQAWDPSAKEFPVLHRRTSKGPVTRGGRRRAFVSSPASSFPPPWPGSTVVGSIDTRATPGLC